MPLLFGIESITGSLASLPDRTRYLILGLSLLSGTGGLIHLVSRFQAERSYNDVLKRLHKLVPEFEQPWLFTENRMVEFEGSALVPEIWIVSPDLGKDVELSSAAFEAVVRRNIAHIGTQYTYIYPDTEETRAKLPALRQLFSHRIDALRRCPLDENIFRKLSVTHIAIFNPKMAQGADGLTAYMELPVGGTPHWIRIENEAVKSLVGRYQRVLESNQVYQGHE